MAHGTIRKAEALALLKANGGNIARTSKATGIPRATLTLWRDEAQNGQVTAEVSETCQHMEQVLADRIESLLGVIVGHMETKAEQAKFSELSFGMEKAVNAMRLLREQPTSISRDDTLSDEERATGVVALLDAARARKNGQPPAEKAVN